MTAYAGKDAGMSTYDTFNVCCVLLPGDRSPSFSSETAVNEESGTAVPVIRAPGRSVQVQGTYHFVLNIP